MSFDVSLDPDDHPGALWRAAGEQESTPRNTFIAPGSTTRGDFGMFGITLSTGQGAVPHFHRGFSESFHVLEGEVRIRAADETRTATAGDFVYVPRLGIHTFRNDSPDVTRLLMIFVPGAPRERYFRELAELGAEADRRGTPPTPDELAEVAARHDQVNVRDPRWELPPS